MDVTKSCSKCGEVKPLDAFSPHARGRLGRRSNCKRCAADYAKAKKREKGGALCACGCGQASLTGRYVHGHNQRKALPGERWCGGCEASLPPSAFSPTHSRCRACRAADHRRKTGAAPRLKLTDEERRRRNAERSNAAQKAARAAESPEEREARLERRRGGPRKVQRHPPEVRARMRREALRLNAKVQKAKRRGAPFTHLGREYARDVLARDPCSYCGEHGATVDHVVAINAGGDSDWPNLTAACGRCNASKQDRSLLAFLLGRTLA